MSVDIFKEGKEIVVEWAKFKEIGDKCQGTYIGVIRDHDDGRYAPQHVYQLQQENGSIMNVGIPVAKLKFHKMMEGIAFGQIIGIKFSGVRPVEGQNDSKQFSVFQDPKLVDEAWLNEQKEIQKLRDTFPVSEDGAPVIEEESEELSDSDDPFEDEPKEDLSTVAGKISLISKLAKEKLNVEPGPSMRSTVIEATGVEFNNENLDKIIEKLKGF